MSSNYDSESEAAESERPENASVGAVEDVSSFKVDAILNENAQDGEEEENLFQSYPATLLDEGGEEEADEGQQEVDIFHKSQQLKEWMLLKISQVDAVQGETARDFCWLWEQYLLRGAQTSA